MGGPNSGQEDVILMMAPEIDVVALHQGREGAPAGFIGLRSARLVSERHGHSVASWRQRYPKEKVAHTSGRDQAIIGVRADTSDASAHGDQTTVVLVLKGASAQSNTGHEKDELN